MSLVGPAIGLGIADSEEVSNRLTYMRNLLYRTAQRTKSGPFRESLPKKLKDELQVQVSIPRAASFAMSFRLVQASEDIQPSFKEMSWAEQVIDELMACVTLVQAGDQAALKECIKEDAYYNNFVSLSGRIAPDGKRIKTVGLTTWQKGAEKIVLLKRTKHETDDMSVRVKDEREGGRITVQTTLRRFDQQEAGRTYNESG